MIKKYKNSEKIISDGIRRVSKTELKKLGYSQKSLLYTKKSVKNPTKFLTRTDVKKILGSIKEKIFFEDYGFVAVKREKLKSLKYQKIFKYTYNIFSDYENPLPIDSLIPLITNFFDFLKKRHHPRPLNQIGLIFTSKKGSFNIMPRYWKETLDILSELERTIMLYKNEFLFYFIVGWIEQSR